jgi:hypothetical protein
MFKNFKDNWQTTLTGIILAVTVLLSSLGVLSPEQSSEVQTQGSIILNAVGNIIGAIAALVLMFKAKD